jgi:carboxyl-terminal processing protease
VTSAIAVILLLASAGCGARTTTAPPRNASPSPEARVLEQALSLLRAHAIDTIRERDLYLGATEGLVRSLGDPWAALLVGDSLSRFRAQLEGIAGGVGLTVESWAGRLMVAATLPDSPARRAGLEPGDRLLAMDDSTTEGWSGTRATSFLRGPEGTAVRLLVERPGVPRPFSVILHRAAVHEPAVQPGLLIGDGIGYLAVMAMTSQAAAELAAEIDALSTQGMRGLVIDLRGNPGGLVEEGGRIADLFLDPGQTIATLNGRRSQLFRSNRPQRWPGLSLALLVDGSTTSAAEVVAAALQDHDRAIIVGTPTFGKGVVQRMFTLAPDVALRFTIARWYAPSGRWIQRGVTSPASGFQSRGGRDLPAGAGVVPDTIVHPAEPSRADRVFGSIVASRRSDYERALAEVAEQLVAGGAVPSALAPVTTDMRSQLLHRLTANGLPVADTLFAQAAAAVDRDLGVIMTRSAFGTTAALRRQIAMDQQVQAARQLLRDCPSSPCSPVRMGEDVRPIAAASH